MLNKAGFFVCAFALLLSARVCAEGTSSYDYDLVIIGGGSAGLAAAKLASGPGCYSVALVNDGGIGGSAIWYADLPSKILIQISTDLYENSRKHYSGLYDASSAHINLDAIMSLVRLRCKKAASIYSQDFFAERNIDFYPGKASFKDAHTISVGQEVITADKVIIATGSVPIIPDVQGIEDVPYMIPDNFFGLDELPASMIIIGGGPLGVEMASCLNRLGVKVTLIMKYGLILPTFDFELVQELSRELQKEGVSIQCSMRAESVEEQNGHIIVSCKDRFGKQHMFAGESLFIATGRQPNVQGLNIKKIGVKTIDGGIKTNLSMQTSVPTVYACGDVVRGELLFGRVAYYQSHIATINALGIDRVERDKNYSTIPKVIYTSKPLAGLGLTEQEARKTYGNNLKIATCGYDVLTKAHIDGTTDGKVKFICKPDGTLLGVHIYGERAGEIVDSMVLGDRIESLHSDYSFRVQTAPNYNSLLWAAINMLRTEMAGR